jgi:hypothetical protein
MNSLIGSTVNEAVTRTEMFTDMRVPGRSAVVSFITLGIIFALLLFFGQFLWNSSIVPMFEFAKPCKSVWHILGLALFLNLVTPGCGC